MPTYDYFCSSCGYKAEEFQKITADPLKLCPQCSKETYQRRPSRGIGLAFKGEGFYINDYNRNQKPTDTSTPSQSNGGGCCPCGKNKPSCSSD